MGLIQTKVAVWVHIWKALLNFSRFPPLNVRKIIRKHILILAIQEISFRWFLDFRLEIQGNLGRLLRSAIILQCRYNLDSTEVRNLCRLFISSAALQRRLVLRNSGCQIIDPLQPGRVGAVYHKTFTGNAFKGFILHLNWSFCVCYRILCVSVCATKWQEQMVHTIRRKWCKFQHMRLTRSFLLDLLVWEWVLKFNYTHWGQFGFWIMLSGNRWYAHLIAIIQFQRFLSIV